MVSGSSANASPKQRQEAKRPRRKQSQELIRLLRLIASQHRVRYEVWPMWSTSEGVRTTIGFELLLCGVNGHLRREGGVLHPVAGCQHCACSYAELREIAEWIVPVKKAPLSYSIYAFDYALHVAPPNRQHRSEIIITTAIFEPPGRNQQSESECLREIRQRLDDLGIREDVWHAAASGNA
jgi:hypothetical protein